MLRHVYSPLKKRRQLNHKFLHFRTLCSCSALLRTCSRMATQRGSSPPLGLARPSPSSTSSSTTLAPQARRIFQDSFERFEKTVQIRSKHDQREFTDTTLRDVQEAATEIERQLAARQCLRNLNRLEPLLKGLEAYSKAVEVLCNGTPYLSWIWVGSVARNIRVHM